MDTLFIKLLNMSITASILIAAVILFRFVFRKSPKYIRCIMWGLVGIRLAIPISLQSALSLLPRKEIVSQRVITDTVTQRAAEAQAALSATVHTGEMPINQVSATQVVSRGGAGAEIGIVQLLGAVWLAGVVIMLGYALFSFIRMKRKVAEAVPEEKNIYLCAGIVSPFVLGLIRPKIYTPFGMDNTQRQYVLAHELCHIKRRDHLIKPIAFLLLSVYWFNPVIWIAYILLCRDIELACDEKVIRNFDLNEKKAYSHALLSHSVSRRSVAACPLAFGEVGVKERVKSVLSYKKPAFWILAVSVCLCITLSVCFLTDPKTSGMADVLSEAIFTTAVDLNRDGTDEVLSLCEVEENNFALYLSENNEPVWKGELGLFHSGYTGFYICETGEESYILQYTPYMNQGMANYGYDLYAFNGKVYTVASDAVSFDIDGKEHLPIDEILAFADTVNAYLSNSRLIVSTLGGELVQLDAPVALESFFWLNSEPQAASAKTLRDKLEAYDAAAYSYYHATYLSERELQSFNTAFFNQKDADEICMPNMFLASTYTNAADIDLFILFYGGVSRQQNASVTQAEKEAVHKALGWEADLDVSKVTTAQMDEVLQSYAGLSLEETNKINLDRFVYLEEYDAYYLLHGDSYFDRYTFTFGYKTEDGMLTLRYESATLGTDGGTYLVTLRETDRGYVFLSNIPVAG